MEDKERMLAGLMANNKPNIETMSQLPPHASQMIVTMEVWCKHFVETTERALSTRSEVETETPQAEIASVTTPS